MKIFATFCSSQKSDQSQGLLPSLDEEWPRLDAENAKMCGHHARRDETGNDGQIGSLYCINACQRYLFMNYEYSMGKRVRYILARNKTKYFFRLRLSYEVS